MSTRRASIVLVVGALALASCGGSNGETSARTRATTSTRTSAPSAAVTLEQAARRALFENAQVAIYVLWHDALPSWASKSTAGPALVSLRSAAATRRNRGIRVRMITNSRRISQLHLDPSYTTATALITDRQRVQPVHLNGGPFGKPVVLNERARVQLHRIHGQTRFVVWKVTLL